LYRVLLFDFTKGKCDEVILNEQGYELIKLASNIQILNVNKLGVSK